jgi:thiamine biosynthesis lipoprotein
MFIASPLQCDRFAIVAGSKDSNQNVAGWIASRNIMPLLAGFVILVALCSLATAQPIRVEESRYAMGSLYVIEAWGEDRPRLQRALQEALDEVDRLDRLLSHYKKESELSRVNREAWPGPVRTDQELFDLLEASLNYSRASNGAFDISVGPLMRAWGFFRGDGRYPRDAERREALARIGYRKVKLARATRSITFTQPGVELDLGGIGKGYAVDRAGTVLRRAGVAAALISAGGSSILAIGHPPGKTAWTVSLQDPYDAEKPALPIQLRDEALSVSGSAEKFFELNGRRYSHIMDPRTGHPVESVLSVAVVSRTGIDGDALDNAFFVLGPRRASGLRRRYPVREVIFFLPHPTRKWTMIRR